MERVCWLVGWFLAEVAFSEHVLVVCVSVCLYVIRGNGSPTATNVVIDVVGVGFGGGVGILVVMRFSNP